MPLLTNRRKWHSQESPHSSPLECLDRKQDSGSISRIPKYRSSKQASLPLSTRIPQSAPISGAEITTENGFALNLRPFHLALTKLAIRCLDLRFYSFNLTILIATKTEMVSNARQFSLRFSKWHFDLLCDV